MRIILAISVALSFAPAAFAQTFIVPEGDCGAITLHATRGADFPNLGTPISADQVKEAYVFLTKPGQKVAVTPTAGTRSLDFPANVADDGVVVAAVEFAPEVAGNETRTEHAKAFVYCADTAPAADWQRTTGLGLEIYPQWNGTISRLKPGGSMRFIVVDKETNKLVALAPMELRRARDGRVIEGVRDQIGAVSFPYEEPGRYMVTTTYRRPDPRKAEHWLVDTSTVTFEIK